MSHVPAGFRRQDRRGPQSHHVNLGLTLLAGTDSRDRKVQPCAAVARPHPGVGWQLPLPTGESSLFDPGTDELGTGTGAAGSLRGSRRALARSGPRPVRERSRRL